MALEKKIAKLESEVPLKLIMFNGELKSIEEVPIEEQEAIDEFLKGEPTTEEILPLVDPMKKRKKHDPSKSHIRISRKKL